MPIVKGPDGQQYNFPDDMDREAIRSAMQKRYASSVPAPSVATGKPDFRAGMPEQPKMGRPQTVYTGAQSGFAWGTADEQAGIKKLRADKLGRIGEGVNFAARFIPGQGVADAAAGMIADMRGMQGSFREGIEDRRALENKARTDNPVSYMAGEIVGSSVAPVGGSARAATKTGQIVRGMATGAGAGAAYSFGAEDGDLWDRTKAGGVGLAGGAVFGGALSAVIPRNIPLGDVLNAELFGAKVERPVLKTIERMLIESGVSPNDISGGIVNIRQRLQGGDVGTGLPLRFKDELVKEFGDKARGVSEAIETQIRGGAARSGSASDAAVRAAVSEDNAAARELFSRSLDQFAGTASRPELRGQAIEQLGQIVEDQYKPILAQPIADPAKKQALVDVLNLPRMKSLASDLAEDAEREGLNLQQMIQRNPAEAAHWMQSKARQLADDRGKVTVSGRTVPDRTMTNRRSDILKALEDAVPGYRETRMEFGDKVGVTQAVNFAKGFLSRAKDDVAVADMAEEFAGMSQAQQQMAVASMRSLIQGSAENVRYVDPEVGTSALRTAEIAKEPVLRALSDVFGEQGTRLADDIKAIVSRTDANRRINPQATGSDTVPKAQAIQKAIRNTRGPLQRGLGAVFGSVPSDLLGSALVGAPTPIGAARAGAQGIGKVADKRAMSTVDKVTELLLARPQNALAPNNAPRGGVPPVGGGSIVDQIAPDATPQARPLNAFANNQSGFVRPDAASTMMTGAGATAGAMNPLDLNNDGKKDWRDRAMTAALYGSGGLAARGGIHLAGAPGRAAARLQAEIDNAPGIEEVTRILASREKPAPITRMATPKELSDASTDAAIDLGKWYEKRGLGTRQVGTHEAQMHIIEGTRSPDDVPVRAFRKLAIARLRAKGLDVPDNYFSGEKPMTNRQEAQLRSELGFAYREAKDAERARSDPDYVPGQEKPPTLQGTATFGNDLANSAVGGTVGGIGGSLSGNFNDYNGDGVIDEKDRQIGFLIGTGVGAFGAPAGTRIGVKGHRFDMKGSGPSGKIPKLKPDMPIASRKPGQRPDISGTIQRGQGGGRNLPTARATGDPATIEKAAIKDAQTMLRSGKDPAQVWEKTGYVMIPIKNRPIIYAPDAESYQNVVDTFFMYRSKPDLAPPDWYVRVLQAAGEEPAPLQLGTQRAPMVKEGNPMNVALGAKQRKR
ncbi:MAG: hypothetical protein EP341_03055 [Sphingomonadales bacterium]|nr:MAG: hypothetical protein EP341_03055 [Sphingomonadales bacterium]